VPALAPSRRGADTTAVPLARRLALAATGALAALAVTAPAQAMQVGTCAIQPRTICTGAELQGVNLNHVDLSFAQLNGADLRGVDFTGANLTNAHLVGANLHGAVLDRADLTGAQLGRADLSAVHMRHARLNHARLEAANLTGSQLDGSQIREATMTSVKAEATNFAGVELTNSNLTHAHATGANFYGVELWGVNLTGANVSNASFHGAHFQGTHLTDAISRGTQLWPSNFNDDPTAVAGLYKRIRIHANGYLTPDDNTIGGGCSASGSALDRNQPAADWYSHGTCQAGVDTSLTPEYPTHKKIAVTFSGNDTDRDLIFANHALAIKGKANGNASDFVVTRTPAWLEHTGDRPRGTPGGPIALFVRSRHYSLRQGYIFGLDGYLKYNR
jgi:uncharacterized protein YjbI with pentapeptide repeats